MVKKKSFTIIIIILLSTFSCKKEKTFDGGGFSFVPYNSNILFTTNKKTDGFYVTITNNKKNCVIKFNTTNSDNINFIIGKDFKNIYLLNSGYMERILKKESFLNIVEQSAYDSIFFEKQIRSQPKILKDDYIHISIITMSYSIYINKDGAQKKIK